MDYWEENGLKKPQQIVVCAACRNRDLILCGARHWDSVMRRQFDYLDKNYTFDMASFEQGFIDQFGDFLTRKEAMKVIKKNSQPFNIDRNGGDVALFSEGLY
jgi:hypothetical protein